MLGHCLNSLCLQVHLASRSQAGGCELQPLLRRSPRRHGQEGQPGHTGQDQPAVGGH